MLADMNSKVPQTMDNFVRHVRTRHIQVWGVWGRFVPCMQCMTPTSQQPDRSFVLHVHRDNAHDWVLSACEFLQMLDTHATLEVECSPDLTLQERSEWSE
jgi:hypothetical protein